MRYQVEWGEECQVVEADSVDDAWSAFCDCCDEARKFPNLHERFIEECDECDTDECDTEEAVEEEEVEESPVSDIAAHQAIESIKRMRAADKLQHIIDNDNRVTVVEAASKRLAELEG